MPVREREKYYLHREQIRSIMKLRKFITVTIDGQSVIDFSSIVTVLNSRNLLYVIHIFFLLYINSCLGLSLENYIVGVLFMSLLKYHTQVLE